MVSLGIEVFTNAPKSKEGRNEIFDTSEDLRILQEKINKSLVLKFGKWIIIMIA